MTSLLLETSLFAAIPNWIRAVTLVDFVEIGLFAVFGVLVLLLRFFVPKIGAIAWVTFKEAIYQPLFLILVLIGLFALFMFLYIPYHTLGEDIKLVITQGLTLIKLMAVFLAVWTASFSVAEELEGRTALMILAKPVSRRQFVFGKYVGVVLAVTLIFLILGFFFLNTISYKVVFDARESAKDIPSVWDCTREVIKTIPSFTLSFFETLILAAIAIAVSTRFSLLPNLTVCLAIYVIGHLAPMIVQSSVGQIALVAFVADLACAVLPVLEHFNMETNVAMDQPPTWWYVFCTAIYAVMYCGLALTLGLFLFEDRDLG
ncbi:MAG: ABC transporter permease [Planctomycetaceae bacterium]|jgi:ABC-type Na+ efflux pump permease subunit|nr:ABC transporter permease [Planctomycetaceae bacterium]